MLLMRAMLSAIVLGCLATAASADERAISAWTGRWAADVSRLPIPAEARPRIATITFAEADAVAVAMPAPGVLSMQLSLGGVPGSTRIYTLSDDRKSMVETAANFGDDGRPYMRTNCFTRVQ